MALMKFSHRGGDGRLYWQGPRIEGDSRREQISCPADWFYASMLHPEPKVERVSL